MMAIPSTPSEIRELMVETVIWEAWLSFDGHAQPSYDLPKTLSCWTEEVSFTGGFEARRGKDETVVEPELVLYFDGDNPSALTFTLWDRFTPGGVGSGGQKLQPIRINPFYGPPFDNKHPWLIVVML